MTKYIAFLRGINVGKIRIKMADLKLAFANMGCKNVQTYLQTGNVVFNADLPINDLKNKLEKGLFETFHYEAFVQLYLFETLEDIILKYPMEREETHHAYIIFIDTEAAFEELKNIAAELGEESKYIKHGDGLLYWKVPKGQTLDVPFAKIIAKAKYKSSVTVRNINTLEKMVERK
ncbi:MAG: DUF1697 domain-containing protein [Saprospiraceae bacterium]